MWWISIVTCRQFNPSFRAMHFLLAPKLKADCTWCSSCWFSSRSIVGWLYLLKLYAVIKNSSILAEYSAVISIIKSQRNVKVLATNSSRNFKDFRIIECEINTRTRKLNFPATVASWSETSLGRYPNDHWSGQLLHPKPRQESHPTVADFEPGSAQAELENTDYIVFNKDRVPPEKGNSSPEPRFIDVPPPFPRVRHPLLPGTPQTALQNFFWENFTG